MRKIFTAVSFLILVSACTKKIDNCKYDVCENPAPAAEVTVLENYLAANTIVATKQCSGYYYIIDAPGSGASPTICSGISVKYKGQLTNGTIFDQTTTPVIFDIGGLIPAWKKGLMQLKPGGKMRMWSPPALAYGNRDIKNNAGAIIIPANSILYFEIELVSVL